MPKKTRSGNLRRSPKPRQRSTRLRGATAWQATKPRGAAAKKVKGPRYVYYFGDGQADGSGKMKPLLGGKGANLAEMTRIGLPVPQGFTITPEVCSYFYAPTPSFPRTWNA